MLMLATRLQQQHDEGASLSDLISIGEEAGLSREAIEEAYHRITTQPSEKSQRELMGRILGNELAAIYLTAIWALATWAAVMIFPRSPAVEWLTIWGSFLIMPSLVGALVRRPGMAACFGIAISLNFVTAMSVRFGPPQPGWELMLFFLPVLLSFSVSLIASIFKRSKDRQSQGMSKIRQ